MKLRKITAIKAAVIASIAVVAVSAISGVASADSSQLAIAHQVHIVGVSSHSVDVGWKSLGAGIADEVIVYDANTSAKVVHTSLESGHSTDRVVEIGAGFEGQPLSLKVAYVINGVSTGWTTPVTFYVPAVDGSAGLKGDTGLTGPKGDKGDQGPSGVVSSAVGALTGSSELINTGGSFATHATLAGHEDLKAGTYLITVNAKAAYASGTGVFPELFVYDGTAAVDFSNDICNVGDGALAQGNASIDSYYTGTCQITLTEDSTLDVYAFGYDQDHGAGSWTLETLTLAATQLQVASA